MGVGDTGRRPPRNQGRHGIKNTYLCFVIRRRCLRVCVFFIFRWHNGCRRL